jgi:IS30 family transposase
MEVIIGLLLHLRDSSIGAKTTAKEHISTLSTLGLGPAEIGRILGKTPSQVSKELYKIRNRGNK